MFARAAVTSRFLSRSADTARPCGSARIESSRRARLHRRGQHIAGHRRGPHRRAPHRGPDHRIAEATHRSALHHGATTWQTRVIAGPLTGRHSPTSDSAPTSTGRHRRPTPQGHISSRGYTTGSHPSRGLTSQGRHIDGESLTRTIADPAGGCELHYPALRRRNAGEIRTPSGPASTTPAS